MIDYPIVLAALGTVTLGLLAVIWGQVSSKLDRMSETLDLVARRVHGHEIRLNLMDGGHGNAE